MEQHTIFTASTMLQVIKDGVSRACVGIEADDPGVEALLNNNGDFLVSSYMNTVAAGVAGAIITAYRGNAEGQATAVHNFFEAVEAWIELGIEIVPSPENLQQPGSPG